MSALNQNSIKLNTIVPAKGAKKAARRVGRGIGSGFGKTAGRGHKGQKSRAGGFHKMGFEGGQMPIQRRIPKRGFRAWHQGECITIRLSALNKINETDIDLSALKRHQFLRKNDVRAKIVAKGTIDKVLHLKGIEVTAGARVLIEKAGGSITLPPPVEKVKKLPKKATPK